MPKRVILMVALTLVFIFSSVSAHLVAAQVPSFSPRVLAWNPNTAEFAFYGENGAFALVTTAASPRALAVPCLRFGDNLIYHLGADASAPQTVVNLITGAVVPLGDNHGAACTVNGFIQVSPFGGWLGVLRLNADALKLPFTVGRLDILNPVDGSNQHSTTDVTAYKLYNDGALMLQFFANSDGDANAADLRWWDGASERLIEQDIRPLENCVFTSGRVVRAGDGVFTLFGEKCEGKGTSWRLMRSAFTGGNSTNIAQGKAGGAYFPTVATSDIFVLPGESALLLVVHNGLNLEIADLVRVNPSDGVVTTAATFVVTDRHPVQPRRFLFSPDGKTLAFITRTGSGAETLYTLRLDGAAEPAKIVGGNRSDRINGVAWSGDGSRIYYATTGDSNSISYLDLASGQRRLLVRGVFQGFAVSADGTLIVTAKENKIDNKDIRSNLILVNVAEQRETVLVEGQKEGLALLPFAVAR